MQLTVPLPPVTLALTVYVWMLALQVDVVPPLLPLHVQLHGPVPVTAVAVPVVQKLVVGTIVYVPLLLIPQVPLIGVGGIKLKVAAIA